MNDNIDKNLDMENLENSDLEQVSGGTMVACYGDCHGKDVSSCQYIEYESCIYGYKRK